MPSDADVQSLVDNCQGELEIVKAQVENLKLALSSARQIGAALGILMATRKITDDQAFALMSHYSNNHRVKVRTVADDVVLTGTLPDD